MSTHVYHLKVHFVSTASLGKEELEVTKEKGLRMIEKALEKTDLPGEVRRMLSGWLTSQILTTHSHQFFEKSPVF